MAEGGTISGMASQDQGKAIAKNETEYTFAKWLAGAPIVMVPVVGLLVVGLKMTDWCQVGAICTAVLAVYSAYFLEQRRKDLKNSRTAQALGEQAAEEEGKKRMRYNRERMESQEKENLAKLKEKRDAEEARMRHDSEGMAKILAMTPVHRNRHYAAFRKVDRVCGGCGRAFSRRDFRKLDIPAFLTCVCSTCCPVNAKWMWMWPENIQDYLTRS